MIDHHSNRNTVKLKSCCSTLTSMFQKIAPSLIPKILPVPSVARRSSTRARAGCAARRAGIDTPAAAALAKRFCC